MDGAAVDEDVCVERSLQGSSIGSAAARSGNDAVPVIDFRRPDAADRMWEAATTAGFFTVIGHGVPEEVIEAAFASSASFFSRSADEKHAASPFAAQLNAGYEFMSQVRPSTGTADQKESCATAIRTEGLATAEICRCDPPI
jgi:isopenicillin N synthase-like dioxygenase